ncbi:MAG: DHH family phosphoesterase, partial [Promethearchaeota archaeon]
HLDSDGLTSGAILGKALYREQIPFQIRVLKQLEKNEIEKLRKFAKKIKNFIIFSDFGSGQYNELIEQLKNGREPLSFLILDHHLPQSVSSKEEREIIEKIHEETSPFHVNPYFQGIDGSSEISGAGVCYFFAKELNERNIDLSSLAIIGALGDIQNQGAHKSFKGINKLILKDAVDVGLVEVVDDLNFSAMRPLNEALAYSSDIYLPGLTNNVNKSLKFLQSIGILIEKSDGQIKTLSDLTKKEKQKLNSAIIEYVSMKLDVDPSTIINQLIVNKYILTQEPENSILKDMSEFSNLLNSCGRTNNPSLGIAIAMGNRTDALTKALDNLQEYKKSLMNALNWLKEENKILQKENLQYFYGENVINENIVGTIATMLVFEKGPTIDLNKPIFGLAERKEEQVFKVSARASKELVEKGLNLSEVIREACKRSNIDVLGGGHPPAAGTKVPLDRAEVFLEQCNEIIKIQLSS